MLQFIPLSPPTPAHLGTSEPCCSYYLFALPSSDLSAAVSIINYPHNKGTLREREREVWCMREGPRDRLGELT
jgi:hypothetical protein